MTLTKEHLKNSVHNPLNTPKTKSSALIESILEIIKSTLESGENVMISGFGKFYVQNKSDRRGRNPQTGEDLMLDSRRVVRFKCSGRLRDRINEE
jgi:integration host factor subunit alpha